MSRFLDAAAFERATPEEVVARGDRGFAAVNRFGVSTLNYYVSGTRRSALRGPRHRVARSLGRLPPWLRSRKDHEAVQRPRTDGRPESEIASTEGVERCEEELSLR